MTGLLPLPGSRDEILRIQSERKRVAFERAKQAGWYRGKLDHINADKLDDPEEWQKIPIVDKDVLRKLDHRTFMEQFCIAPRRDIAEYWRYDGHAGLLSEDLCRRGIRHGHLGAILSGNGDRAGRFLPHIVSYRHSPGRPDLGAVCA